MTKNIYLMLVVFIGLLCTQVIGQTQSRYLDDIFAEVKVTTGVEYQNNVSVFPAIVSGGMQPPAQTPKLADIYEPVGDTVSSRPLLILCHSGTFFPAIVNGTFTGGRQDSLIVEMAERFAKKGYVVAAIDNRLGWLITADIEGQRKSLLEAAYRGIQDLRAAVRFFRKTVAEDGNPYSIDPTKIATGGSGTGGYLVYGAHFLKRIDQILLLKFFDFADPSNPVPYVDTMQLGDPYGLRAGTLNVPQWPTYDSDISVGFCLGGACGDQSWIEAGDPPIMSIHSPDDNFAPYDLANVLEPINNLSVIDTAAGGFAVVSRAQEQGINDLWKDLRWRDPYNLRAAELNNGFGHPELDGLWPLSRQFSPCASQCITSIPGAPADSCLPGGAPYDWIDSTTFVTAYQGAITGPERYCQNTVGVPNDPAVARTYIDSLVGYIVPRMSLALGLVTEAAVAVPVSIENSLNEQLRIFPNPANTQLTVTTTNGRLIDQVTLLNLSGQIILQRDQISRKDITIERNDLSAGIYLLKIQAGSQTSYQKVMFD